MTIKSKVWHNTHVLIFLVQSLRTETPFSCLTRTTLHYNFNPSNRYFLTSSLLCSSSFFVLILLFHPHHLLLHDPSAPSLPLSLLSSSAFFFRRSSRLRRLSSQGAASCVASCSTVRRVSPGRRCGASSLRRRPWCCTSTERRRWVIQSHAMERRLFAKDVLNPLPASCPTCSSAQLRGLQY